MFGRKKFGLKEAKRLAKDKDVSIPTVLATLRILDVPNVVKEQAQKAFSKMGKQMTAINDKMVGVENADQRDEAETQKTVAETIAESQKTVAEAQKERLARKRDRAYEIADLKRMASKLGEEIEKIKSLEKYA